MNPGKNLRIRGGFSSENTSFSFGIGYLLKSAQLDLGFATHETLGSNFLCFNNISN